VNPKFSENAPLPVTINYTGDYFEREEKHSTQVAHFLYISYDAFRYIFPRNKETLLLLLLFS
jgi:hypothetical protein